MKKWMWTKKTATLLFCIYLVGTSLAYATVQTFLTIEMSGNIISGELSSVPTSFAVGDVVKNVSVIKALSLTNTGDLPINALHLAYALPPLFNGTLTWDLEGQTIVVGETKMATLNLTVTDAPDGPFNFNITINGDC